MLETGACALLEKRGAEDSRCLLLRRGSCVKKSGNSPGG